MYVHIELSVRPSMSYVYSCWHDRGRILYFGDFKADHVPLLLRSFESKIWGEMHVAVHRHRLALLYITFRPFVSLHSARFRFLVQPPSGTTCLCTSHSRRHSRFSDNDSRPFCFPVHTKTPSLRLVCYYHHSSLLSLYL